MMEKEHKGQLILFCFVQFLFHLFVAVETMHTCKLYFVMPCRNLDGVGRSSEAIHYCLLFDHFLFVIPFNICLLIKRLIDLMAQKD